MAAPPRGGVRTPDDGAGQRSPWLPAGSVESAMPQGSVRSAGEEVNVVRTPGHRGRIIGKVGDGIRVGPDAALRCGVPLYVTHDRVGAVVVRGLRRGRRRD